MSGVNECTFIGNLGKNPEVRHTKGGTAVCTLSLGCSERRKVGDKWETETEWVRVVVWGKTAEFVGQHASKGRQLYVRGRLKTRTWEKDGARQYVTEIVADRVELLGARNGSGGQSSDDGGDDSYIPNGNNDGIPF